MFLLDKSKTSVSSIKFQSPGKTSFSDMIDKNFIKSQPVSFVSYSMTLDGVEN